MSLQDLTAQTLKATNLEFKNLRYPSSMKHYAVLNGLIINANRQYNTAPKEMDLFFSKRRGYSNKVLEENKKNHAVTKGYINYLGAV